MPFSLLWFTALLPGLALLARFHPRALLSGPLALVSLSFVVTAAALLPWLVAAYVLHFSVGVTTPGYGLYVVAGALDLVVGRRGRFAVRALRRTTRVETWVALALLVPAVVLGGHATYDMPMHAAKILALREHGFGLADPHSPLPIFETKHNVNVVHGLSAIFSELADARPMDFLFHSHWFALLLMVGAFEFCGTSVFRSRRVGRFTALGALAVAYARELAMVQNSLASFAVFPIVAAAAFAWLRGGERRDAWLLGASSLALGVVHLGIAVLTVLVLGPLCLFGVWYFRRPLRTVLVPWILLATCLPFAVFSALQPNHFREQLEPIRKTLVVQVRVGSWGEFPIVNTQPYQWVAVALAVLLLVQRRWSARRAEFAWLIGVVAIVCSWMFEPLQFALIDRVLPPWILRRMMFFGEGAVVLGLAALIAHLVRRRPASFAWRAGAIVAMVVACTVAYLFPVERYFERRSIEREWLAHSHEVERIVAPHLGARPLVAADPWTSLLLPAVHTCAVLAINRGHANPADADWLRREPLQRELLAPDTSTARRAAILESEKIDFVLIDRWMEAHASVAPIDPALFATLGRTVADEDGLTLIETASATQ
ncbi:MAG: hypothetical protein K8S98_08065 [Planctomycetes bacterium]|nr:hypothetical protein [Planctomycetota bacterium]